MSFILNLSFSFINKFIFILLLSIIFRPRPDKHEGSYINDTTYLEFVKELETPIAKRLSAETQLDQLEKAAAEAVATAALAKASTSTSSSAKSKNVVGGITPVAVSASPVIHWGGHVPEDPKSTPLLLFLKEKAEKKLAEKKLEVKILLQKNVPISKISKHKGTEAIQKDESRSRASKTAELPRKEDTKSISRAISSSQQPKQQQKPSKEQHTTQKQTDSKSEDMMTNRLQIATLLLDSTKEATVARTSANISEKKTENTQQMSLSVKRKPQQQQQPNHQKEQQPLLLPQPQQKPQKQQAQRAQQEHNHSQTHKKDTDKGKGKEKEREKKPIANLKKKDELGSSASLPIELPSKK